MSHPSQDREDLDFEDDDYGTCNRCDGEGRILVCPDDMCRGAGECMHGDGYVTCPACNGEGER